MKKCFAMLLCAVLLCTLCPMTALGEDEVVLRVCSWEEYIDEGGWGEDEVIDLDSGDIFGENHMVDDFEDWYYETYGKKVRVEYSTFGTNEDLYNMLTLGDVFDVVCPSEYMIMKLIAENKAVKLSPEFFDEENELNYYIRGVSPYIRNIFVTHENNSETWEQYAAGYMWGVTGFVYNPDVVSREEASTWHLMDNTAYSRQITVKDNVRDTYFAAVGALKSDLLTDETFRSEPDYAERLQDEMNDTSDEMIARVQDYLQGIKDNLYSFETDSGKADVITGKVVANYQWSGDAVYALDQAEEDECYLEFAVPEESTNVYFDGWLMLKCGVEGDADKQHAAEAWINFTSRPDNAIRNMYYIGYTSVIGGGDDGRILEYLDWNYGAEEDEEAEEEIGAEEAEDAEAAEEEAGVEEETDAEEAEEETVEYSVAHFFAGEDDDPADYVITVPASQLNRQLGAQYPSEDILNRASIMIYFDQDVSVKTNDMWIRVRCFNVHNVPVWAWCAAAAVLAALIVVYIKSRKRFAVK